MGGRIDHRSSVGGLWKMGFIYDPSFNSTDGRSVRFWTDKTVSNLPIITETYTTKHDEFVLCPSLQLIIIIIYALR